MRSIWENSHQDGSDKAADRNRDFSSALIKHKATEELNRKSGSRDVGAEGALESSQFSLRNRVILGILNQEHKEACRHV